MARLDEVCLRAAETLRAWLVADVIVCQYADIGTVLLGDRGYVVRPSDGWLARGVVRRIDCVDSRTQIFTTDCEGSIEHVRGSSREPKHGVELVLEQPLQRNRSGMDGVFSNQEMCPVVRARRLRDRVAPFWLF